MGGCNMVFHLNPCLGTQVGGSMKTGGRGLDTRGLTWSTDLLGEDDHKGFPNRENRQLISKQPGSEK